MTLKDQALFTASALANLAREMALSNRDVPERFIVAIAQHSFDLLTAAIVDGVQSIPLRGKTPARVEVKP